MGWLFGKKKVPEAKVPFPAGRMLDEGALRLPGRTRGERVIEPEAIKAAAGLEEPLSFPEAEEGFTEEPLPAASSGKMPTMPFFKVKKPVYIKVDIYQRLLGEMDTIKAKIMEMQEVDRKLETSEYNEENNFAHLRRTVRSIHDHLSMIDRIVFKAGE
ncbi:MAG: hypothetical protein AABX13_06035 [Nanoarchaeota archaeon]